MAIYLSLGNYQIIYFHILGHSGRLNSITHNFCNILATTFGDLKCPERVLWQTMKTKMKCRKLRHFIRVYTVYLGKLHLQRKKYNIILEVITGDPSIYTVDHPDITVSNFMEYSIGPKRVNHHKVVHRIV